MELLGFKPKAKEIWELTTAQRLAEAKRFKDLGNEAFKAKNLVLALEQYEEVRMCVFMCVGCHTLTV